MEERVKEADSASLQGSWPKRPPVIPFPGSPSLVGRAGLWIAEKCSGRRPHGGAVCAGSGSQAAGREGPSSPQQGSPHPARVSPPRQTLTSGREHHPPRSPAPHPLPAGICSSSGRDQRGRCARLCLRVCVSVSVFRGPLWRLCPPDLSPEDPLVPGLAQGSQATAPEVPPRGPLLLGFVVRAWVGPQVGGPTWARRGTILILAFSRVPWIWTVDMARCRNSSRAPPGPSPGPPPPRCICRRLEDKTLDAKLRHEDGRALAGSPRNSGVSPSRTPLSTQL
ncbi:uncharacterized protein [Sagmatias obliquidens]|uniref:uncharacterized protein n=1 Tax=Sagmatias obliquidens TaxID=3371155 RepID=UPI000F44475A|nr:uncharacterized protein LOC113632185 [Lagenorhynchus obliquidens]